MIEATPTNAQANPDVMAATAAAAPQPACEDCLGSGGWYRYEPALEPSPGLLYLSCLQCRGSGRTAPARA
jgi:hypothetical protein